MYSRLPYVVDVESGKALPPTLETAAVLCLSEVERKKGGWMKEASEEVLSVSKLHYPLWILPWRGQAVVVEGMGNLIFTDVYEMIPNVEALSEDFERSSPNYESYKSVLKTHSQTFRGFLTKSRFAFEGLISDGELLQDIFEYFQEAHRENMETDESATLPASVDCESAEKTVLRLSRTYNKTLSDAKALGYALEVLDREHKFHVDMLNREIAQIKEEFSRKLDVEALVVEENVKNLKKERDSAVGKIGEEFQRETSGERKKRRKLEKELEKLETRRQAHKGRLGNRKRSGDKIGVQRWKHRLKTVENKIGEVESQLKPLVRFIDSKRDESEALVAKVKRESQILVEKEKEKLSKLREALNLETAMRQRELGELAGDISTIVNHVEEMIKEKEEHVHTLTGSTIPLKLEDVKAVAIPFYAVTFHSELGARTRIFPPLKAGGKKGILAKIRKALSTNSLESRINLLLNPRSKGISRMFSLLEQNVGEDKTLRRAVRDLADRNNVMKQPAFKKNLSKGLRELGSEGWVKPEEENILLRRFAVD